MSHDIYLTRVQETEVAEVGNYTSNVSPMWRLALGHALADLDGKIASECIQPLTAAVAHMRDPANKAAYAAMNPENGWGNANGAKDYLAKLLAECENFPDAKVRVSH